MRDPAQSTFAFVMYPEATPIVEAERAIRELGTVGIPLGLVVANMVLPENVCETPYARARYEMQQRHIGEINRRFDVPVLEVPLIETEIVGLDRVHDLIDRLFAVPSLVA
jgi:arsenite-transporting ATPase